MLLSVGLPENRHCSARLFRAESLPAQFPDGEVYKEAEVYLRKSAVYLFLPGCCFQDNQKSAERFPEYPLRFLQDFGCWHPGLQRYKRLGPIYTAEAGT